MQQLLCTRGRVGTEGTEEGSVAPALEALSIGGVDKFKPLDGPLLRSLRQPRPRLTAPVCGAQRGCWDAAVDESAFFQREVDEEATA